MQKMISRTTGISIPCLQETSDMFMQQTTHWA